MKGKRLIQLLALPAAVLLSLSGTYFANAEDESFLRVATAAAGTPTIDGTMEAVWNSATEYQTTEDRLYGDSNPLFGKGAKAKFRLLWDSKNIYVYVQVTDPVLNSDNSLAHMQDSVCIQVEEDGSQKGAFEPNIDKNFFINYKNVMSGNDMEPGDGKNQSVAASAVKTTSYGYDVEIKIPMVSVTLDSSKTVGFELAVMDADASGSRKALMAWNSPVDETWQDTAYLGTLKFAAASAATTAKQQTTGKQSTTTGKQNATTAKPNTTNGAGAASTSSAASGEESGVTETAVTDSTDTAPPESTADTSATAAVDNGDTDKKGPGALPFIIGGIVLVLIAGGVTAFLLIRKRNSADNI